MSDPYEHDVLPASEAASWPYAGDVSSSQFTSAVLDAVGSEYKLGIRSFANLRPRIDQQTSFIVSAAFPGLDPDERVGDWIQPRGLDIQFILNGDVDASSSQPYFTVRVGCLLWRENSSFDPNFLMNEPASPQGPYSYRFKDSIAVLYDKSILLSNDPASSEFLQTVDVSLDIGGLGPCLFDGNLVTKNHIYLYVITNASGVPGVDPAPFLRVVSSFYYTDT